MGGTASKAAGTAGTAAARKLPTQARPEALKETAAAVSARSPPPETSAPQRPPAAAAPQWPSPPVGVVHEKDEGLLNKLASLQSSVERITQTPSGLQLDEDMRTFALKRKESLKAAVSGKQPFNTLAPDQLRELFKPDDPEAPESTPVSREKLAAQFNLEPATLDLLLRYYNGITIYTDNYGQLYGRPNRPRRFVQ